MTSGLDPSKSFTFTFNPSVSDASLASLERELEKVESRISNIVDKATLSDYPIVRDILKAFSAATDDEFQVLGKALIRISQLRPVQRNLEEEVKVLRYLRERPSWAASVFGDFSSEVDTLDPHFFSQG